MRRHRHTTSAHREGYSQRHHNEAERARERLAEQQTAERLAARAEMAGWAPGELQIMWGK
jgi:hypothetical protein